MQRIDDPVTILPSPKGQAYIPRSRLHDSDHGVLVFRYDSGEQEAPLPESKRAMKPPEQSSAMQDFVCKS